jgi:hypothetical protein
MLYCWRYFSSSSLLLCFVPVVYMFSPAYYSFRSITEYLFPILFHRIV